jgi:hypothetical protein
MQLTPSIFYNPNDDTDARAVRRPEGGMDLSPRMKRARSVITAAMLIRSATTSDAVRLRRMKAHILGRRLPVSRLASLWSYARDEALFYGNPERAPLPIKRGPVDNCSTAEWAGAAWLVMRAALSLLVNVPLADERDADAFTEIVTTSGYVLPNVSSAERSALLAAMSPVPSKASPSPWERPNEAHHRDQGGGVAPLPGGRNSRPHPRALAAGHHAPRRDSARRRGSGSGGGHAVCLPLRGAGPCHECAL